jgi:hypothetical protein
MNFERTFYIIAGIAIGACIVPLAVASAFAQFQVNGPVESYTSEQLADPTVQAEMTRYVNHMAAGASMYPTHPIEPTLVTIDVLAPFESVQIGDIITFNTSDGEYILHRVVDIHDNMPAGCLAIEDKYSMEEVIEEIEDQDTTTTEEEDTSSESKECEHEDQTFITEDTRLLVTVGDNPVSQRFDIVSEDMYVGTMTEIVTPITPSDSSNNNNNNDNNDNDNDNIIISMEGEQ